MRKFLIPVTLLAAAALNAGTPQTLSFSPIPDRILGISPFLVSARATSRLPVIVASSTPTVCTAAAGLIDLIGSGICSLTASQPGNAQFSAALPITRSFNVNTAKISGTLTQAPGSPVPLGTNPYSVLAADFNGDGIDDLVTANGAANTLTVLLGDGSGGFSTAPGSPFPAGPGPVSVASADFNGDGFRDLAVGNTVAAGSSAAAGEVTVLLGNGMGGFTPAAGSPFSAGINAIPQSIATGDFNADGAPDLAVADRGNNAVLIFFGDNSGGFVPAAMGPLSLGASPSGPVSLAVGDFNGDGAQDLATANQIGNTVSVFLGNGAGGFVTAPGSVVRVGAQPLSIALGDFNSDGFLDIATANNAGNSVTVLLGNGDGTFSPAQASPFMVASPWSVSVADMNGDGQLDLAVSSVGNGVTLLLGNGGGGFTPLPANAFAGGTNPVSLAIGDFNADGIEDLAAANYGSNNLTVLLGGLAPTISVLSTTSSGSVPFGQSVQLTVTVSARTAGFTTPGGTVTFMNGTTVLGTAAQMSSPYTFTASGLAGGLNALSAMYSGDGRNLSSATNTAYVQVTVPTAAITALTPAAAMPGGPPFTLTVTGTGFMQASQVQWNLSTVPSTYVSATQLTAAVPGGLIAMAGTAMVTVANPGAALSNTMPFSIVSVTVSTLTPSSAQAMGPAFKLCAKGSGFATGAVLQWNGTALPAVAAASGQVCGTVSASLIATIGTVPIKVANPDGTSSAAMTFNITMPPVPPPTISTSGIVPVYSSTSVIQPGSWVSIYGSNFGSDNIIWNGEFPTSMGGVSVTINKKPAYLWSVSPTQINLQAPDDTATGKVNVVVTTPNGSVTSSVTLAQYGPSFSLLPASQYAAGVILTSGGAGAYGNGAYDLLGPAGAFTFKTRAVKAGETLLLYGVGFGPTTPPVPAGKVFNGSAATTAPVKVTIGGTAAKVLFAGITEAGLYQINLIVPNVPKGDQALKATAGTASTPAGVLVTVQ